MTSSVPLCSVHNPVVFVMIGCIYILIATQQCMSPLCEPFSLFFSIMAHFAQHGWLKYHPLWRPLQPLVSRINTASSNILSKESSPKKRVHRSHSFCIVIESRRDPPSSSVRRKVSLPIQVCGGTG